MNKTTTYYFDSAKNLPLAMSFSQIESLVAATGVPPNPPKSGWGLKNFLIMTTTIITLSAAILLTINTGRESKSLSNIPNIDNRTVEKLGVPVIDSTKKRANSVTIIDENNQKQELVVKKIGKGIYQEKEESRIKLIDPNVKLIGNTNIQNQPEASPIVLEGNNATVGLFDIPVIPNIPDIQSGLEVINEPFVLFDEPDDLFLINEDSSEIQGTTKTITKSIGLEKVNWFLLDNNQGNITIRNGNSDQVQFIATVTIEGKSDEDEQMALADFDLNFERKKDQLGIGHNWTGNDIGSCFCWSSNKKNKIKLSNGETVRLKKVKIDYEIVIPNSINLELKNHYGDINVPDRAGELKAVLFKGDLHAGNIQGDLKLTEKYGKASVKSANKVEFNLFKGDLSLGVANDIKGKISYSELNLTKVQNLNLTSFQSDATIKEVVNKLVSNFRYGDLIIENNLKELELVAFQAKVKAGLIEKSKLNLSYTKFEMTNGNEINLEKAFQSKIFANNIGQIKGKANYSPIEINKVIYIMELATFQGSIAVESIEPNFTKVNLNTRYTNVNLNFNPSSSYSFEAKTSFTAVNMPTNVQNLNVNPSNSNVKSHLKGQVNNGSNDSNSLVYIESFQGKLNLQ